MEIYITKDGDNIHKIANAYGVSVDRLIRDNGIEDADSLQTGRALVILRPESVHKVMPEENIFQIALKRGITVNSIYRNNYILFGKPEIKVDDILILSYDRSVLGKISINACIYPDINKDVLSSTLPYLTYLTIIGTKIRSDGTLEFANDADVVELSRFYGVSPLMHITVLDNGIIKNENIAQNLVNEIEATMLNRRYDGVNIDFHTLKDDELPSCDSFYAKLKHICNIRGKEAFITTSCELPLGENLESADGIIIMPENMTNLSCNYVNSTAKNRYLSIRGYGVDHSEVGAHTTILSNTAALMLAADTDSDIIYDNALNESYFSYTDMKNIEHKVSIDDPRSILATLQQAFNDNYSGISVWNIDKFCPYLWAVINNCVDIVRTGDKEA